MSEITAQQFNKRFPVGTEVTLRLDNGSAFATRTRSAAWELGHGKAVVLVEGKSGGWAVARIEDRQR